MQPKLFERQSETVAIEDVLLYALGDFQSRGKILANRQLAFDRLRGAFLRAFLKFGVPEMPDDQIVAGLRSLGAKIVEVPRFVAKHPFRITVPGNMAKNAASHYLNERHRQA